MSNYDTAKQVATQGQARKVDGVWLDITTASAMVTAYDALSESARERFNALPLTKAATISLKLVR